LCPKFHSRIYDCGIEFVIVMTFICFGCEGMKLEVKCDN